jgi:ornithine cyclodeaminase
VSTAPPVRFLSRADVIAAGGADLAAAMDDVRAALAELRTGAAEMPAEISVSLGDGTGRAYALPARVAGTAGVKWTAHRPPAADGMPAAPSVTLVNDARTGLPLGIVESALLTSVRTAAVSALVLQNAGGTPRHVTLLGAGAQARTHLRMLVEIFPTLASVTLWNRDFSRGEALAREMQARTGAALRCVADLDAAVAPADAVIACTAADTPLLGRAVMRPGRLVMQIGHNEVSFGAIDAADAVLVDLWGDFRSTSGKSLFRMHRAGRFEARRVTADLAGLVLDGWRPPARAAVYFSSFGLNVFDVALAARVLAQARRRGLGTALCLSGDANGGWPLC